MMSNLTKVCIGIFALMTVNIFAQGDTCAEIEAFCGGQDFTFPNSNPIDGGAATAESGIDLSCATGGGPNNPASWPYPAWYYLQIDTDGDLEFTISQSENSDGTGAQYDVDFIAWGPFSSSMCDIANLLPSNKIDCSWLNLSVEQMTINNAIAGEVYIVMITNFVQQQGFITLEQVNSGTGAGATDCDIVNTAENYCEGETVSLDGTITDAVSYIWYRGNPGLPGNVIAGETGPILNNVMAPSALYRVEKFNSAGGKISQEDFDIVFSTVPIVNATSNYVLCDDATPDGRTEFVLSTKDAEVAGAQVGMDVSYHLDMTDAINRDNPLPKNGYINAVANLQPIVARIENSANPDCFDTIEFDLIVDTLPTAATADPLTVCDDLSNDGVEVFNLISQQGDIIGTQSPLDVVVTYHESMPDAANDLGAILLADALAFSNVGSPDPIYVRVENISNPACFAITTFNLVVNPVPTAFAPTPLELCDDDEDGDDANGFREFDLTQRDAEITGGNTNYTVDYYETLVNAQAGTGAILDPTMYTNTSVGGLPQTLYVRVTDTSTTPSCYVDNITLIIRVLENPTPETDIDPIVACDDNGGGDGMEIFDLTENENSNICWRGIYSKLF